MHSIGFDPIIASNARALVLGSLPGRVSLAMRQYYAQPRNAFWKIMGRLFHFDIALPYEQRTAALQANRVAVWDVCLSAERPGSLDAAIDSASVRPNEFGAFFAQHASIQTVCFNGAKAQTLYRRLVLPHLPPPWQRLNYVLLPSTSPAHAAMSFDRKLEAWRLAFID
jgi:double-stranded uracil-DNA glycosylase